MDWIGQQLWGSETKTLLETTPFDEERLKALDDGLRTRLIRTYFPRFEVVANDGANDCGFFAIAQALQNARLWFVSASLNEAMMQLRQWAAEYARDNYEYLAQIGAFERDRGVRSATDAYDQISRQRGVWLNGPLLLGLRHKLAQQGLPLTFMYINNARSKNFPNQIVNYPLGETQSPMDRVIVLYLDRDHYELIGRREKDGSLTTVFQAQDIETAWKDLCANCPKRLKVAVLHSGTNALMDEHIQARQVMETARIATSAQLDAAEWVFCTSEPNALESAQYLQAHNYGVLACDTDDCFESGSLPGGPYDVIIFEGCFMCSRPQSLPAFTDHIDAIYQSLTARGNFIQRGEEREMFADAWARQFVTSQVVHMTNAGERYVIRQRI